MSIFSAKEYWSTTIKKDIDEEFDSNSIAIGNIDNDPSQKNKICISSMKGYLRIYEPLFHSTSIENLLLEHLFPDPILQIAIGHFVINSDDYQLAILHPKKLSVVQIQNLRGASNIRLNYEHKFKRNGYSFTTGRIGDKNYEIFFIQSIDCAISIYEQDSLINIVEFKDYIFPGCIAFLSRKDAIVVSNTSYEIECYNYNTLATTKHSANSSNATNNNDNVQSRQWKAVIGELTKKIDVVSNEISKREEIVILSETLLNIVDSNGKILYQRKLDYEPMTLKAYNITDDKYIPNKQCDIMCMIATNSNHILIYKGINLVWAVKTYETPVYLNFADFDRVKSLIVLLSDTGNISVCYLGMEKAKNLQVVQHKQIDPNFLLKENKRLTHLIDNYSKGVYAVPDASLSIEANVNSNIVYEDDPSDKVFYKDNYGKIYSIQVELEFSYDGEVANDIHVNIIHPYNVVCDDPIFTINTLNTECSSIRKTVSFRVIADMYPTFTNIDIYATYYVRESGKNEKTFQSTSLSIELPLSLFIRVNQETKKTDSQYKITLCTDKQPIPLNQLFKDLNDNYIDSTLIKAKPNMITFIYPNKTEVTVIVSKSNGKYRIQSNQYETLLFISNQLVLRLHEYFEYNVQCYIDDTINFQKFISIVANHFNENNYKKVIAKELEKYTSLYTNVQKSLLTKYKEKNPPQLENLDFLLKQVDKEINNKSDELMNVNNKLKVFHKEIAIWIESILFLLKLRARMSEEHYQIVRAAFPLDHINDNEYSWEDVTMANMTNLIVFYFKKGKTALNEVQEVNELDKWNKYFVLLLKEIIAHKGLNEEVSQQQQQQVHKN